MVSIQITAAILLLASVSGVTIEEVQQHGSSLDCWSAIYGKVYDFTNYGASHSRGGGPQRVWDSCGVDFTDEFDRVHGDTQYYLQWEGIVEIGDLSDSAPPPTEVNTLVPQTPEATSSPQTPEPAVIGVTIEEVQQHTLMSDCWSVIYGKVYDFTNFGALHTRQSWPQRVWDSCGIDYTSTFDACHGNAPYYLQWEGIVEIGDLIESPTDASTLPPQTPEATMSPPTTPETTMSPPTTPEPALSQQPVTLTSEPTTPEPVLTQQPATTTVLPSMTTTEPTSMMTTPAPATVTSSEPTYGTTESEMKPDITLDELTAHDSPTDCWVLFYDQVYDLTDYAYRHPIVGEAAIHPYCGVNGTDAFAGAHDKSYLDRIEDLLVGPLASNSPTEPPTSETTMSEEEVAEHDTPEDCWIVFYDSVYNMTQYAYTHPGPAEEAIHPWCGLDGTTAYDVFHKENLLSKVEFARVGALSTSSVSVAEVTPVAALCGIIISIYLVS